jgi:hypothetical protein
MNIELHGFLPDNLEEIVEEALTPPTDKTNFDFENELREALKWKSELKN